MAAVPGASAAKSSKPPHRATAAVSTAPRAKFDKNRKEIGNPNAAICRFDRSFTSAGSGAGAAVEE